MTQRFTIAIGDIHGMSRAIRLLLESLTQRFPAEDTRFVFLGDLIDRGYGSVRAIDDLCAFFETHPSSVLILGNHDEYLLRCLQGEMDNSEARKWLRNGGEDTLQGYSFYDDFTLKELRKIINGVWPKHLGFLQSAVSMFETERHCFVHAGVDPSKTLAEQDGRTLRWIREGFLDYEKPFEKIIVHGHTITESGFPEVHHNRIALDSGSYQTGRISAAIFEDDILIGFMCATEIERKVTCQFFDASMNEVTLEPEITVR